MKIRLQKSGFFAWNKPYKRVSVHFLIRYPLFFCLFLSHLIILMWCFFIRWRSLWKNFFNFFCSTRNFWPFSLATLWGTKNLDALWQLNTHSSGTFLCGGESSSRMKVRQDPPAPPGYNGKQGGERFRTILKYPTATDMAMKRYRANDTSLRSWRRTRQGWDSHGPDSLSGVWWFPFLHLGFEEKLSATTKAPKIIFEVLVDQKWFK